MIEASAAAVTHHTEYFCGVRRKLNWYLQLIFIRKYVLKRMHPGLPETEESKYSNMHGLLPLVIIAVL